MTTYRRLPVYLLLDCSESMAGEAIEQVSEGVDKMLSHLMGNPYALETVWLSIITFSNKAEQVVPLSDVSEFECPKLSVRTGTALGAALRLLTDCMAREVRKTAAEQKGDYKPLVFLFTDGLPTDAWEEEAKAIKGALPQAANFYAIGCGPDVDVYVLQQVTNMTLTMPKMDPGAWDKVFVWLSSSVETTSEALTSGLEGQSMAMPDLPGQTLAVAAQASAPRTGPPSQVFIHALCSKTGQPYLMRFRGNDRDEFYQPVASHPLEVVEEAGGGSDGLPSISTDLLEGCPPCPHCDNQSAMMCDCGALGCYPGERVAPYECPSCHQQGIATPGGAPGFDVKQSEG